MEEQSTFDEFNNNLRGTLIRPGDTEYDESRSVYNAMTDRKPKCIPNEVRYRAELGKIYAKLGVVEKVIQEGKKAIELMPVSQNTAVGTWFEMALAEIYAWTGHKEPSTN